MKIAPEQLLYEVEDVIRTMPARETLSHSRPENEEWLGRAAGCIHMWDSLRGVIFKGEVDKLGNRTFDPSSAIRAILTTLQQARTELRLSTVGPLTIAV